MKILVTGCAGFIGYYVCDRLCQLGHQVIGLDNLNDYYDVSLKRARLALLDSSISFDYRHLDLADRKAIADLFASEKFDRVIHLAAQAGVRYSIDNPMAYIDSNMVGMATILEGCRHNSVEHLVFASSSSVYGLNTKTPFSVADSVDHPVSLYAATKKSNELMAHTYAHLYGLPVTGLRFFTVYGPWGRPDMAPIKFARLIKEGKPIDIYNHGNLQRDFTYIDDIVEGILRAQAHIPAPTSGWTPEQGSPGTSSAPYRIFNIGHGQPVALMDFIGALEREIGIEANKNFMGMQPGDVYITYADTEDLFKATGYQPQVNINKGVKQFVEWFKSYY